MLAASIIGVPQIGAAVEEGRGAAPAPDAQ
jgi:hypothetical protein